MNGDPQVPSSFVPDSFVPDTPVATADQMLAAGQKGDAVDAALLKQASQLPPNQARAWLTMMGPRGANALKLWEAQQPSAWDLPGIFASKVASGLNPLPLLESAYEGTKQNVSRAYEAATTGHPITALRETAQAVNVPGKVTEALLQGAGTAAMDQFKQAYAAYNKGDVSSAAGHAIAGAMPLGGPQAAQGTETFVKGYERGDPRMMTEGAAEAVTPLAPIAAIEGYRFAAPKVAAATAPMRAARAAAKVTAGEAAFMKHLDDAAPPTKAYNYEPEDVERMMPHMRKQGQLQPTDDLRSTIEHADNAIEHAEQQEIGAALQKHKTDLIRTDPTSAAQVELAKNMRKSAQAIGLKEIADLPIDQPLTLEQADKLRRQLNAENRNALKKNNYDRADTLLSDPEFAVREAVVDALRDGVYDQLQSRGIDGVRELRRDVGSIMKVRNAIQNQVVRAADTVAGTQPKGVMRRVAPTLVKATGGAIGLAGGAYFSPYIAPGTALVGSQIGEAVAEGAGLRAVPLTRNQLMVKAMEGLSVPGGRVPTPLPNPPPPTIAGLLGPPPGNAGLPPSPLHPLATPPYTPGVSGGGLIPAAPISWNRQPGGPSTPAVFSGDPNAVAAPQLTIRALLGPAPSTQLGAGELAPAVERPYTPGESGGMGEGGRPTVPAAPLAYEVVETTGEQGGLGHTVRPTQYSSEPGAKAAAPVELTGDERYALYWIKENMDALPFVKQSLNFVQGRGSTLERSGGAAGAKIYEEIVGRQGKKGPANIAAGRGDVNQAITNLFEGKLTKTGEYVLDVVRDLVKGRQKTTRLMDLPPPDIDNYLKFEDQVGPDVPRTQHAIDFIKSLRPEE